MSLHALLLIGAVIAYILVCGMFNPTCDSISRFTPKWAIPGIVLGLALIPVFVISSIAFVVWGFSTGFFGL